MIEGKHKLSFLDRLRGWHWEQRPQFLYDGTYLATIHVRVRNWCGCEVITNGNS